MTSTTCGSWKCLLASRRTLKRTVLQLLALAVAGLSCAAAPPTFSKDVAPIFYKKCTGCHHPNDAAPMSLLDYKSARPWAAAIGEAVKLKRMPPWFADPHSGPFSNDPSLTAAERATITQWVEQGAKEGNPADLPAKPVYTDGWHIGKPDAIFDIGETHTVKQDFPDEYVSFTVPTNFTEGHWVQAVEMLPGNRHAVHHGHVSVIDPTPAPPKPAGPRKAAKPQSFSDFIFTGEDKIRHMKPESPVVNDPCSYSGPEFPNLRSAAPGALVSFLPGMPPDKYPAGSAKWIPPGASLKFTLHYHAAKSADGTPVTDRTSVGLIFAKEPPATPIRRLGVDNYFFAIPAGAANQEVRQCAEFDRDSLLMTFTAHMHYRGKDALFQIQRPGEAPENVLYIPKYDFNWQLKYVEKEPVFVPKGTKLIITFHYDNSPNNPGNPDPAKPIRWGDPSAEEMMSGWLDYIDAPVRTSRK